MKIIASYKTDIGNYRKNNQDAALYIENKTGQSLAAVCDGLGGHKCGEIASNMAIKMLKNVFQTTDFNKLKHDMQIHAWLQVQIDTIHEAMYDYSLSNHEAMDMGTTMVIVLIANNKAYLVNIGDSRIYLFNENGLKQLTVDHNVLNLYLKTQQEEQQELVDLNQTYWKALTSALGPSKTLKTDIFHLPIFTNTYFLLTSDGAHDFLENHEITSILMKKVSPNIKVKLLIKQALNNASTDNVTVLLIEIN
ncbi:PP2C family protein-serine/threonine phosphatase [Spiroplasma endosymbiont of Virgichneumon dumeticola]|uniref:PP2C family protein-serine/threonine phosphatase n=1 Tax=Spiroplasma endosymbiont of Virgichneumon dumeticola TaxID=3139323 RepID=UPI0035C8F719